MKKKGANIMHFPFTEEKAHKRMFKKKRDIPSFFIFVDHIRYRDKKEGGVLK